MHSTFSSYHLEQTNYFVQHPTTVMSMTTCFIGKSFVWLLRNPYNKCQHKNSNNETNWGKTATICTKGYSKFMGTQEWLKCRLMCGLSDIKHEEQMLHMVEVPDVKKYMR
jgi:hypothetical protein